MKGNLISRKQLLNLYQNQKLSTDSIARIFKCNHVTILNYLKKYNISRRSRLGNRKPISLSREILFDLYVNKKLSHRKIAEKFGHSRYGIQRWLKIYKISSRGFSEANQKYQKSDFNKNSLEKAYLIGFRLGDLNVSEQKKLIQVRCSTTIQEQIDLISQLFEDYGHPTVWKAKRGTWEIVILLNKSFNFLLPKGDFIEEWITKNQNYFLSFFAGYSDAEGSFYLKKSKSNLQLGMFEIQTYDKNILEKISKFLELLKIENKFTLSKKQGKIGSNGRKWNKDAWKVTINKKQSLWNFIKIIEPFHRHKKRLKDLVRVKDNLIMRNNIPFGKKKIIF